MILKSKLQIECTIALQLQVQQQQKQCTPLLDLLSRCALTYKCDCHFITREEVFALVCPTGLLLNHNGAIPFRFTQYVYDCISKGEKKNQEAIFFLVCDSSKNEVVLNQKIPNMQLFFICLLSCTANLGKILQKVVDKF